MTATALKDARMEFKTTWEAKELLNRAALLDGMDLSAFVLGSAIEKARKVLTAHSTISLSKEGQGTLAALLAAPSRPSKAMKNLMSMPDLPVARK